MMNEVAERYAQGLMELAVENNTVSAKHSEAEYLLNVLAENSEVELFFKAVKISKEEKRSFIDNVLGKAVDHDMVSFLKLLVDKGRISYLNDILKAFMHLAEEKLGMQRAVVESARKLSEADLNAVEKTLAKKYNRKFILKNRINPDLIAGIRVVTDNHVIDASMAKKIEDLRNTLLTEVRHEQ